MINDAQRGSASHSQTPHRAQARGVAGRVLIDLLSRTQARRVILLLGIAVAAAVGYVQVKGNVDQAARLERQTADVIRINKIDRSNLAKLREQQAQGAGGVETLDAVLERALPPVVTWDAQYSFLNALADATGTELLAFTHAPGPEADGLKQTSVALSLECTYRNCMRFVNGLQGLTRLDHRGGRDRIVADGPLWTVDSVSITSGTMNLAATLYQFSGATQADTAATAAASNAPTSTESP